MASTAQFTLEDFEKLIDIFNLLEQTVELLLLMYPDNQEAQRFEFRLSVLKHGNLENFLDSFLELEEDIPRVFPDDLAQEGNACYQDLDLISDDIYAFIDANNCGRNMAIIQNDQFF